MRKRVLWNAPHVRLSFRISLAMFMTMIVSLAVTGCGGGGGGTLKPPGGVIIGIPKGDPNLATITGIVTDTTASATPIAGAIVKVAGTALQGVSGTNGKFAIINVPVQAVGLTVVTPSVATYYGAVVYGTKQYDDSVSCPIPVTGLQKSAIGPVTLPNSFKLYPAGSNPPYPPYTGPTNPANGCPL